MREKTERSVFFAYPVPSGLSWWFSATSKICCLLYTSGRHWNTFSGFPFYFTDRYFHVLGDRVSYFQNLTKIYFIVMSFLYVIQYVNACRRHQYEIRVPAGRMLSLIHISKTPVRMITVLLMHRFLMMKPNLHIRISKWRRKMRCRTKIQNRVRLLLIKASAQMLRIQCLSLIHI